VKRLSRRLSPAGLAGPASIGGGSGFAVCGYNGLNDENQPRIVNYSWHGEAFSALNLRIQEETMAFRLADVFIGGEMTTRAEMPFAAGCDCEAQTRSSFWS
jgi:hypothetical protein